MTTIKRGTIRSYDAGEHRAAVQIAGSLATYLDAIPVATGIFPDVVVVGRECTVLFHADDDPTDAVVVSVQGAVPPTTLTGDYTIDGDLVVNDQLSVQRAVQSGYVVNSGDGSGDYAGKVGVHVGLGLALGISSTLQVGVGGYSIVRNSAVASNFGLQFAAGTIGQSLTEMIAVDAALLTLASGKTITDAGGVRAAPGITGQGTITNFRAVHAKANLSIITNRYGFVCDQITGGTIARLMQLAGDWFIVKGSGEWTPTANETPVWITEGATPTSRQVKWKDGASIGSGDRVMVLV